MTGDARTGLRYLSADDVGLWAIGPNGAALRYDLESGELVDRFEIDVDRNLHVNGVYAGGAYWYQ